MKKQVLTKTMCGSVLGGAMLLSAGVVQADEVTTKSADATVTMAETASKPAETKTETVFETVKEKTEIEVEKIEKSAPEVQNPNPEPVEPKQPEFNPEVKKTENTVEKVAEAKGNSQIEFTAKSKTETTTKTTNETKQTTLVQIYDFSSSYRYKLPESIQRGKMLIEKALTNNDSKVILQVYTMNFEDSYTMNSTGNPAYSSLVLTKSEALAVLDKWYELAQNAPTVNGGFDGDFGKYFNEIFKSFGDKAYALPKPGEKKPLEDVVKEVTKPSDTISVIQFTDGWDDGNIGGLAGGQSEAIDETYANWAKERAKTFMTVVNRNVTKASDSKSDKDTNSNKAIDDMKRLGHPNIYDSTGKDKATVDAELLKQFMETAVEKVTSTTTVTKQKGQVTVTADKGLNLTAVKMTSPDGKTVDLTIKDGKATFSGEMADGKYVVAYTYEGQGTVTGTAVLDGKEVAKKSDSLSDKSGFVKAEYRSEDGKELKATTTLVEAGKSVSGDWKSSTPEKTMTKDGVTYVLTGIPSVENGKVTRDNTTLHYVYKAKPADKPIYTTTFKVVDAVTGKQIDGVFTVAKGFDGDAYSVKAPTVEGYQVTLKEGSSEGKFAGKDVILTYIAHEKGAEVKAIFVDESGKQLKDPEVISKAEELVGTGWKYEATVEKEITVNGQKYVLVAVPEVSEGKVTSDRQTLRFVYKKVEESKKVEKLAPKATKMLPKTSAVKVAPSAGKHQYVVPAVVAMVSLASLGYAKVKKEEE